MGKAPNMLNVKVSSPSKSGVWFKFYTKYLHMEKKHTEISIAVIWVGFKNVSLDFLQLALVLTEKSYEK